MSVTQKSNTEWDVTVVCGDWNTSIPVEITAEGILVDYDLISWAKIDAARATLPKPK